MGDPVILLTLLACFGNSEDELTPQINGTITTAEASGEVAVYKAFAFHVDDNAVFYLTRVVETSAAPYVFLVGQVADGIATPVVGILSDKVDTKLGTVIFSQEKESHGISEVS